MTGGLFLKFAVSVVGIAVLVGVSYLLGAWRSAKVTRESAAERLAFDEPDFHADQWFVGVDEKSAAATSADGREVALVFVVGDGLATRRFKRDSLLAERRGATVVFRPGEPSLGRLPLAAGDEAIAEQWLLRLSKRRL